MKPREPRWVAASGDFFLSRGVGRSIADPDATNMPAAASVNPNAALPMTAAMTAGADDDGFVDVNCVGAAGERRSGPRLSCWRRQSAEAETCEEECEDGFHRGLFLLSQ